MLKYWYMVHIEHHIENIWFKLRRVPLYIWAYGEVLWWKLRRIDGCFYCGSKNYADLGTTDYGVVCCTNCFVAEHGE